MASESETTDPFGIDWSLPPRQIYAMLKEQAAQVYRDWQAEIGRRLAALEAAEARAKEAVA